MSDYITEVLKNKMIPFGVINGKRKNLSKFNPYHDELGRFTSGGAGRRVSLRIQTQASLDSDYLTHSGYDSLKKPVDDLEVAKETGAPIRWLMPSTMAKPLAELYDKFVLERSNTNNPSPPDPNDFAIDLVTELKKLGFSESESYVVAEGLVRRAKKHSQEKVTMSQNYEDAPLMVQVLGGVNEVDRWNKQTSQSVFGDLGDEFVGIHVNGTATLQKIMDEGRYKTQFETDTSGGFLDTKARSIQEVATFSLHPSMNPKNRPVYGQVYTNGFEDSAYKEAWQYGQIVLVVKKSVHKKTSWTAGDSLNNTVQASSLTNPSYHGGELQSSSGGLYGGSSLNYIEAQIHGGVKVSDISHIIVSAMSGDGAKEYRINNGIPSSIKIVYAPNVEENDPIHKLMVNVLPSSAIFVAYNNNSKLYVSQKNNDEGYVKLENGMVFKVNPQDVYSRGYWTQVEVSKFNPYHDELGRFTFASGNRTISAKPKMSRRALGLKGKVSSIIRFSSEERKAAVEKLAAEGSSKLLMPPDANGIAQVLPQGAADKRYGKTVAQIKKSIAKLGVESVAVTPEFAKGKNARRQMQATAQALEEAKAMGIPIDKLTMRFTTALRDADGSYAGDENQRAGDIMLDYTDDQRAKFIADKIANDSGPRILNAPTVAQTEFTSDYPAVTSQTDLVAKYTYGVAVHEIGHHYTYINVNNPNAKRQFGLETPARYGTSDVYEMLAEGFTAWWLLGRSRVKSTQTFYKRWLPFVKVVLNGNDTGFGIPTPEALLKAMVRKTKVLNLLELSPTHPLMVYLTDGASIPDDIEKFNPNHDKLGRFTFASGTRTKMPPKKPTLIDWKAKNEYDDKARQVASQILRGGNQDERLFSVVDTNDDNSALFIGKEDDVPTPFIKSMYEVENGGLTSKVKKVQFYDSFGDEGEGARRSGSLGVITEIYDSKGKKVGYADRSLVISDGQLLEISHNNFSLDKEYTGSGFGAVFFSNSISHYEEVGASTVITQANIDVGGYAWAKAGFSFQYESSLVDIAERAGDILRMSPKGIANTFLDRMTNGRFTDVDSVKTSNALSNESKKKIIKSIEKAGKELEQSRKERIDLFGKLEDGEYLGIRNSSGFYDEDYPNGYTPKKFAELGKEDSVKILVPVRTGSATQNEFVLKEVEMWVGKATMLGSDWGAVLVLGGNDEWEPQR